MRRQRVFTQFVSLTAITFGCAYLVVRATTLGSGWMLGLSALLLAIEVAAFVQFGLFAYVAWHAPDQHTRPGRSDATDHVDVIINAHQATLAAVERTLVGVGTLDQLDSVVVVDSMMQTEVSELAASLDARYVVDSRLAHDAGTAILDVATSEFFVWLDAGQVPMPELVAAGSQRFTDRSLAVWQSAIGLLNKDSFVHVQRGRDEDALFREVIGPGLDDLGAAPWFGPGSMIRREALEMLGGFADGGSSAVSRTGIRLNRAGWSLAFTATPHVRTIAPDDLDDYLIARRQRATETLGIFTTRESPLFSRGLSLRQRLSHCAMASTYFAGLRQLLFVLVLIVTLLAGRLPIDGPLAPIVSFWALSALFATAARRLLAQGSMRTGDWTRHGWRTLGADVAGLTAVFRKVDAVSNTRHVPTSGIRTLGRLRTLTAVVVALDVALLLRGATLIDETLLTNFSAAERVLVITVGLVTLVPMIDVLQLVVSRKQRRRTFRLEEALDVVVGDTTTRTIDLATSGIGVLLPFSPAIGALLSITLQVPDLDGVAEPVVARGIVRAANLDRSGLVRVGIEFDELTVSSRRALIEYCMIGGQEARRAHITEPRTLSIERPHQHRVHPIRALTALASAAALTVMLVGPSAASAAENSATYEVKIVDTTGAVVAGVPTRYNDGSWRDSGRTDVDGMTAFAAPAESVKLELRFDGGRLVLSLEAGQTDIILARIEAGQTGVDTIDVGSGWIPFVDGMHVLPGRVAIRLDDGSTIKTTIDAGRVFEVDTRTQRDPS